MKLDLIDHHVHSSFSFDCKAPLEAMAAAARAAGLAGMCATEHMDLTYPLMGNMLEPDYDAYRSEFLRVKREYAGFSMLYGIECGYDEQSINTALHRLKTMKPDFILWSVHVVDGVDPWEERYFKDSTREEGYLKYLKKVRASLDAFDGFDAMTHLGYCSKFAPFQDAALRLRDAPDLIGDILKKLIGMDKALEVNTSGYKHTGGPLPGADILTKYRDLGGRKILLGSDAHQPNRLSQNFDRTILLLKSIGFCEVMNFTDRGVCWTKI